MNDGNKDRNQDFFQSFVGPGIGGVLNTDNSILTLVLYQAIVSNDIAEITRIMHLKGSNVKHAFTVLVNAGLSYDEHFKVYEQLMAHPISAINLSMAFVKMHKSNFSYNVHEPLYKILINHSNQSDKIVKSFVLLAKYNVPYQNNEFLYHELSKEYIFSKTLAKNLAKLYRSNLNYQENKKLYHALIDMPILSEKMVNAFIILSQLNIFYKDNSEIYDELIHKKYFIEEAMKLIVQCISEISPSHTYKNLYYLVLVKLIVYQEYYRFRTENIAKAIVNLVQNWSVEEIDLYGFFCKGDYNDEIFFKKVQKDIFIYLINIDDFDSFIRLTKMNFGECNQNTVSALEELKKTDISFVGNEMLYFSVIKNSNSSLALANVYSKMKKNGMPYKGYSDLYKFLLTDGVAANLISNAFIKLKKLKIYYHKNAELYDFIGKSICNIRFFSYSQTDSNIRSKKLVKIVSRLIKQIPFSQNINVYRVLFENEMIYLDSLPDFFKELEQHNIDFSGRNEFLIALAKNINKKLMESVRFFLRMKIDFEANLKYQSIAFLIKNVEIGAQVVKKLISVGYLFGEHQPLFDKILEALCIEQLSHTTLLSVCDFLYDYAHNHTMGAPCNLPISLLLKQIENIFESYDAIAEGPLNKSTATLEIEKIIGKISRHYENLSIKCNELGHYIIFFSKAHKINLSLLIRNANLSQLTLDDILLNNLQIILNDLIEVSIDTSMEKSWIVNLLSEVEKNACSIYFGDHIYKNINRLFRGERLSKNTKNLLNSNPQKNLLAYFLLGCIVNNAVNKISGLVHQLPIKKILDKLSYQYRINLIDYVNDSVNFNLHLEQVEDQKLLTPEELEEIKLHRDKIKFLYPDFYLLDRGEILSKDAITKRTANIWFLPALTSFSAREKGVSFFHKKSSICNKHPVRTKLENALNYYVLNLSEEEVILPQGETIRTIHTNKGNLISRIVRSPLFERKNHYLSELALVEAFKKYLSKEYSDEKSEITIGKKTIFRPNHDLTHTYRVMLNIYQVIYYFSKYANELEFKIFCQTIQDDEIEWLRIAAAFSVTGRKGECSAKENLEKYNEYREESVRHLNAFLDKFEKSIKIEKTMRERMSDIILNMGNPHYKMQLNSKTKNMEDIFYWQILTIAHKLDLLRCYSAKEYRKSMELCLTLSEDSPSQKHAFEKMVNYNIELIKIHGATLNCIITDTGDFKNTYLPYQKVFKTATSIRKVFDRSELVTLPQNSHYLR